MQHKNANKRRKMAVEVIAISAAMVFALVSNINGHNIQIAIAATKNNNSPTTTNNSYSSTQIRCRLLQLLVQDLQIKQLN
jgi:hypothetical protein